jgi:hypothetical protein
MLIGANYDAYVVHGTAQRHVADNDHRRQDCLYRQPGGVSPFPPPKLHAPTASATAPSPDAVTDGSTPQTPPPSTPAGPIVGGGTEPGGGEEAAGEKTDPEELGGDSGAQEKDSGMGESVEGKLADLGIEAEAGADHLGATEKENAPLGENGGIPEDRAPVSSRWTTYLII